MNITKTVGVYRDSAQTAKDFEITRSDGQTFLAVREGDSGLFRIGEECCTLKSLKRLILDGAFDEAGDLGDQSSTDVTGGKGTWDCLDPCAVICRQFHAIEPDDEVMETLNCFGWLTEDGQIDHGRVDREYARVQSRRKEHAAT